MQPTPTVLKAQLILAPLDITKDYWFDWRHDNPATTVFTRP